MSKAMSKDWILETIDQLRKRKARPDLERICHMVERKHGLSFEETVRDLELLVSEEIIIKVDYKGSTSYRNAAKYKKNHYGNQVFNSKETGRRLQSIVLAICEEGSGRDGMKTNAAHSDAPPVVTGASVLDIEEWFFQNDPDSVVNLSSLLEKEVEAKHLNRLPNGHYIVGQMVPETPTKLTPASLTNEPSPSTSGGSPPTSAVKQSPGKKGRPPTKRKKIKKSLGPDFEHYSVIKKKRGKNAAVPQIETPSEPEPIEPEPISMDPEPRCDYCLQTSASNRKGSPEDLLICKDCQAKAHPSCMEYSESLAKRARNSPWQCIDCKTCYICEDAGDPDAMLFCDACDKGYHMNCHNPPVETKPTGKWVCSRCILELGLDENEINMESDETDSRTDTRADYNNGDGGPSCLPTPSDSPVNFKENLHEQQESIKMNGNLATPIPKLATTLKRDVPDASEWSIEDVVDYFEDVGFTEQADVFREQEIDGKSLLLMKRSDVLTGLSLKLGPALKIYAHVQRLQTRGQNFF